VISSFARHVHPCAVGLLIAVMHVIWSPDAYCQSSEIEESFTAEVQPLLKQYCFRCHNADDMKSGIRVDLLDDSLQDRHLFLWRDIRKQIDGHAMPPEDEPQPSDAERQRLSAWIENAMNIAKSRNTEKNGSVRRLTVSQYRNTMRELLGLQENLSNILPPDGMSKEGFANNGQVLGLSPLQMEYYFDIAERSLDLCIVDENTTPAIQNFRMDLGAEINPEPCKDSLVLGANNLLLNNSDFVVEELAPRKPFEFRRFSMKKQFDFIEGYVGNDTIREWRHFDSIYHAVFACMRGTEGYPLGEPYQAVQGGLLLRPAIPSQEIFGESNTYGPMANFKISLRELPDHGDFRVVVRASRYDDGLLLDSAEPMKDAGDSAEQKVVDATAGTTIIEQPGVYQVDVSCTMAEPAHLLRLKIGDRDFSKQIKSTHAGDAAAEVVSQPQSHAVVLVRLKAGPLTLQTSKSEKTSVLRVVLTRIDNSSELGKQFLAFEKRSPMVGLHLGLRRDCGSTLNPVGPPQAVTSSDPTEFHFAGAINDFPYPAVEKDNVNYLAGIREIGVRSEYTDGRAIPRLKIHSVEFEGPLYASWPPATHRKIFLEPARMDDPPLYARQILQSFATRAWRRPVSEAELQSLIDVWQSSLSAGETFPQAIKDSLLVVLTSPQFLFLIENSVGPELEDLNDWELASKLSYFLCNEPPDQKLLSAAAAGTLHAGLNEHTNRLMKDSRFGRFLTEFTSQWLSLEKFDVLEVNRAKYPLLTRDTRAQLREEPVQFLRHLFDQNLSVSHLVDSDFVVANDVTANYYGLASRSDTGLTFAAIQHESPDLGGLLTQASILAGLSDGRESNPIKRGAWFARKMIADPPDDPPPNVPQLKEDGTERTLREKLERHRNQNGCVKCHSGIDPWGVAFEQYDAAGRFKKEPTDASSTLPDGTEVADLRGLKSHLATDQFDQVAFSFMKHLACYATGRSLTYSELEWLKTEGKSLKSDGYRMQDMVRFLVMSDLFLKK
jgi:hypothetical protein